MNTDPRSKDHGPHEPVTITDKRGRGQGTGLQPGQEALPQAVAEQANEVPSELDEALMRVDRIQELQEKGRAELNGGPPLSGAESAELLRLQAEQQAVDTAEPQVRQARTAFLVIVSYDGSVEATHNVNLELEIEREANVEDMFAGVSAVARDIQASLTAKHVVFGMQQGVAQLAERQRGMQAAQALQGKGIDPRSLRKR